MNAFLTTSFSGAKKSRNKSKICPTSRQAQQATNPQQPKFMLSDILIVAANRGLGAFLAAQLQYSSNLHTTHRPITPPSEYQENLSTIHALDALDRTATKDLIASIRPRTIVSCLGGDVLSNYLPDYEANKNLIDAAKEASVDRFVLISALGAGNSENSVPFQVMDTMRPLLLEKSHAEAYLRDSSVDKWTIVRPVPIVDGPSTGTAVVTEGLNCYGTVTRPDLASVVANVIASENAVGKTLHVVDRTGLLITAPYVRPLEFWEPLPFDEFTL